MTSRYLRSRRRRRPRPCRRPRLGRRWQQPHSWPRGPEGRRSGRYRPFADTAGAARRSGAADRLIAGERTVGHAHGSIGDVDAEAEDATAGVRTTAGTDRQVYAFTPIPACWKKRFTRRGSVSGSPFQPRGAGGRAARRRTDPRSATDPSGTDSEYRAAEMGVGIREGEARSKPLVGAGSHGGSPSRWEFRAFSPWSGTNRGAHSKGRHRPPMKGLDRWASPILRWFLMRSQGGRRPPITGPVR
jgi:hypothetical protein